MKSHKSVLALLLSFSAAAAFAQNAAPVSSDTQNAAPKAAATPAMPEAPAATPATPAKPASTAPTGNHVLPVPDRSTPIGGTITGSLDASSAVSAIQIQEFDRRDRLVSEINERVNAAEQQLNDAKSKAGNVDDSDKKQMETAWNDYNTSKQRLQSALEAARQATDKTWDRARAALAAEYGFFTASVGAVEVATPN